MRVYIFNSSGNYLFEFRKNEVNHEKTSFNSSSIDNG